MVASVANGARVIATHGAATLTTCSTSGAFDVVGAEPRITLMANVHDQLTLALPVGWRFLHWDGWDRPEVGEGANVWPGGDTLDRPQEIHVPVPHRLGASLAGYNLWVVTDNSRVVGRLEIQVLITVR